MAARRRPQIYPLCRLLRAHRFSLGGDPAGSCPEQPLVDRPSFTTNDTGDTIAYSSMLPDRLRSSISMSLTGEFEYEFDEQWVDSRDCIESRAVMSLHAAPLRRGPAGNGNVQFSRWPSLESGWSGGILRPRPEATGAGTLWGSRPGPHNIHQKLLESMRQPGGDDLGADGESHHAWVSPDVPFTPAHYRGEFGRWISIQCPMRRNEAQDLFHDHTIHFIQQRRL